MDIVHAAGRAAGDREEGILIPVYYTTNPRKLHVELRHSVTDECHRLNANTVKPDTNI